MKKFLTMALALMMVLSLFAVPTMAAIIEVENIYGGGFDPYADGEDMDYTHSTEKFSGSSKTYNNELSKVVDQSGDKVLQLSANEGTAQLYSPKFAVTSGTNYTVSADVYIARKSSTTEESVDVGSVGFEFPSASANDKVVWGAGTATPAGGEAIPVSARTHKKLNTMENTLPLNTWIHIEVPVTISEDIAEAYLKVYIYTYPVDTTAVFGYIDDVSVKYQAEGAAVTKTVSGNGAIAGIDDVVAIGSAHELKLVPAENNFLKTLTVDGVDVTENVTESFDTTTSYFVYNYPLTVTADTAINAEFVAYDVTNVLSENIDDVDYEILTYTYDNGWTRSGSGVVSAVAETERGNVLYVEQGEAKTPSAEYALGLYKISFDAKGDTAGNTLKFQHSLATNPNSAWNGTVGTNKILTLTDAWASYDLYLCLSGYNTTPEEGVTPAGNIALTANGALKIDNFVVEKLTVPTSAPVVPSEYAVSISGENAITSVADATVTAGETTTYTVAPKFGYYIQSITVEGVPYYTGFNAYTGGTYETSAINADTAIVVTTAELSEDASGTYSTDVATLSDAFVAADTAVTFGKVLDANATSYGVELTQNGEGVLTYHGGGPLYKANTKTAEGQYAVEFVGLAAGEYQVRTYVIVDGVKTFGAPTTFTVVE